MIPEIVKQWDERKHLLEESFRVRLPGGYRDICQRLVEVVLTEPLHEYYRLDADRIHVVDDGDYQGVQLFLIALDGYQPDEDDYVWFSNYYGSCSGCDAFQSVVGYDDEITDEKVQGCMDLALHMVQRMKWLAPKEAA